MGNDIGNKKKDFWLQDGMDIKMKEQLKLNYIQISTFPISTVITLHLEIKESTSFLMFKKIFFSK